MYDNVKLSMIISLMIFTSGAYYSCQKNPIPVPSGSLLKSGESVIFLGDSITEFGENKDGFVYIIRNILNQNYKNFHVQIINAGRSGDKIEDIAARLDRDVICFHPDWTVISIGINDVWHRLESQQHSKIHLPNFESRLESVILKLQKQKIKIALCTATVIMEDIKNRENRLLRLYNEKISYLANKYNCLLIDVNKNFLDTLANQAILHHKLTHDGVHLNKHGNKLMASIILQVFGF